MDTEIIKATTDLTNSLSQFKTGMFYALCSTAIILGLGGTGLVLWFRRAMQKDQNKLEMAQKAREAELESAKQSRAALYTQAQLEQAKSLAILAVTIQNTHDASATMNQTTNKTLDSLGTTIARNSQALTTVAGAVQRMTDKVDGRLSREDSRKFVSAKLTADMYRALCSIIEKSFTENHFQGREAFISDRVRSRMRDVMVAVRKELKDLPISVSIDPYFPTTTDDSGERFALCDLIWNKVSALFADPRPIQQRLDEATLIVENSIKDHVARVERRDHGSDMYDASGMPVPRTGSSTEILAALGRSPQVA